MYAFARANKDGVLQLPLLKALHQKLREIGNKRRLKTFYKAWEREHSRCSGHGRCPIPAWHDWAILMLGYQTQDARNAKHSASGGAADVEID